MNTKPKARALVLARPSVPRRRSPPPEPSTRPGANADFVARVGQHLGEVAREHGRPAALYAALAAAAEHCLNIGWDAGAFADETRIAFRTVARFAPPRPRSHRPGVERLDDVHEHEGDAAADQLVKLGPGWLVAPVCLAAAVSFAIVSDITEEDFVSAARKAFAFIAADRAVVAPW